jgi:hypothetical protein
VLKAVLRTTQRERAASPLCAVQRHCQASARVTLIGVGATRHERSPRRYSRASRSSQAVISGGSKGTSALSGGLG